MRRLLLVLARDPVGARRDIVAEEGNVDPAVGKERRAGRLVGLGELWLRDLLLDLRAVGLLARSRDRLAVFDAEAGVFLGAVGQAAVGRAHRLLGGVEHVGDGEVDESRGLKALASYQEVFIVKRWRCVIPVEDLKVGSISEDDQFVARRLAGVVASRGDGEVVSNPGRQVFKEVIIDKKNDVILLGGSHGAYFDGGALSVARWFIVV